MTKSVKDKIKGAKLPTATITVYLRADLRAEYEDLQRQLEAAQATREGMLNTGTSEKRRLAEQIKAIEAQMAEESIVFHMRALGREPWRQLITAHPAREGVDTDAALGLNSETFWPALLRASVYEPDLDDEDWAALLDGDTLTDKQFTNLCDLAWGLNRRDVSVPFSFAASAILAGSGSE